MIDLVVAAGPGCRQTANEVIFLKAQCKQDNASHPPCKSLWVSIPLPQFSAEMHTPVNIAPLLGVELRPHPMICRSPNPSVFLDVALFGDRVFTGRSLGYNVAIGEGPHPV